jgi:diguanylate cyclase (GGDEF)-like protein
LIGQNHRIMNSGYHSKQFYSELWNTIIDGKVWKGEIRNKKKDGTFFWVSTTIVPFLTGDGQPNKYTAILTDITEKKLIEVKFRHMAFHDALTQLPNRYFFNEQLERAIHSANEKNQTLTVLYIDLDRFKLINDTLGHTYGDFLLQQVAKKLQQCIPKSGVISRYGGDEFTIFLIDLDDQTIVHISHDIVNTLSVPYYSNGLEAYLTTSVGISMFPRDGVDAESLIKYADTAMYMAKERGKNNFQFYTSHLSEKLNRKTNIETGLRKAINDEEFDLHYQPQVNLETCHIVGLEALIRWNHPVLGYISPSEFIPVAEEIGLIVPIGNWIIKTVCLQIKKWLEQGFVDFRVAVNVSSWQFQEEKFVKDIKGILNETKIDPKYLEIEITESFMQNIKGLLKILNEIKSIGITISIDDFGTGYSSLSVLKHLPIDNLKIDQSFVFDLKLQSNITASIVKTIVDMGHNLNISLIAEGIETEEQLMILKQMKCNMGQGYLFSKPVPAMNITKYV